MRKLIYISLIVFAGCETTLTPQPPSGGGAGGVVLANYFWHDSILPYHYQALANNQIVGTHTILMSGGTIFDVNQSSNITTTFSVNSAYAMSGFTPSDIFGFDPSLQVVTDTNLSPIQWTEAIHSIATAKLGGFGQTNLYAASDSVLYYLDANGSTLDRLGPFPKSFTLAEDAQEQTLFAYQMGGDSIIWYSDFEWVGDTTLASITAFASATGNFYHDLCWFACGSDLYRITTGSYPQKIATLASKIVTLTGETNGVAAGLDNGAIYDVSRTGQPQLRQTVYGLVAISLIPSGLNPVLAGTSSGVFDIPTSGPAKQIDNGAVSLMFSTGNSIFASVGDSVFHYNANGTVYGHYASPPGGVLTQFAHPTVITNASQGVYALSGTSIFRRDSSTTATSGTWTAINQTVSSIPALKPGSLTLLSTDTTPWFAGFVEQNIGGQQRGYAYAATSSGPFASYSTYNNVLIVNYTAKAKGIVNTTNVPQYNIYYEEGVGPVIIEKIENGQTTTTSLVK